MQPSYYCCTLRSALLGFAGTRHINHNFAGPVGIWRGEVPCYSNYGSGRYVPPTLSPYPQPWHTFLKIWSVPNSLQRAPTPDPASSTSKKVRQMDILMYTGLMYMYPTGRAALPSEDISQRFFQGQRNPLRTNTAFISDEYERINIVHFFFKFFHSFVCSHERSMFSRKGCILSWGGWKKHKWGSSTR